MEMIDINAMLKEFHLEALTLKNVLIVFTIFIGIDIITGILNAIISKTLDSTKFKKGLYGKLGEMCVVTMAIVLNKFLGLPRELSIATAIFYICQEAISILENTANYISYPSFIKDILVKINNAKANAVKE